MSSDLSTNYIEEAIKSAENIFMLHEDELKNFAGDLLLRAIDAAERSQQISREFGIDSVCMKCDTEEGGSCCGKGIENYYDVAILLANLLLGVKLPGNRFDPSGCYFLGERGCVLGLRHTICVNYLCERLYKHLGQAKVIKLQSVYGEEIHLTFLLHEKILKFLEKLHHERFKVKDC